MERKAVWVPPGVYRGYTYHMAPIPYDGPVPDRLWSMYAWTDPGVPPPLGQSPSHLTGAFLEDHNHDWIIRDGHLHYYSRVTKGGLWLLLEFGAESVPQQ